MRWFKHDIDARSDLKIKLLKKRFGAEGYGIYFQILELIGEYVEDTNMMRWGYVDTLHTVESIAEECSVTTEKLHEVLNYCDELGLFEKREGSLYCGAILKRLDNYATRLKAQNKSAKKLRSKYVVGAKKVVLDIDKNRIDKNRIEIDKKEKRSVGDFDRATQNGFLEKIKEDFPLHDIPLEIEKMRDFLRASTKTYQDYQAFVRNWMRRAEPARRKVIQI